MSECECDSFVFSFGCCFVFFYVAAFETHVYCYLDVIFCCQFSFCSDGMFLVFKFCMQSIFFFGFSLPFVWFCLKVVVVYSVEVVRILFASS